MRRRRTFQFLPPKKDFIQAKYDFIDEMLKFGRIEVNSSTEGQSVKILDVGCGIGGTTRFAVFSRSYLSSVSAAYALYLVVGRYLARKFGNGTQVEGITLSENQARRARELAAQQGVHNAAFRVMDALSMDYPDASFDFVWACESGEHMPDKRRYVEEMARVLKPGGRMVVATWCQREEGGRPFTKQVGVLFMVHCSHFEAIPEFGF